MVQDFDCGVAEISDGLRDRANNPRFSNSGTWVAVDDQSTVIGFYDLVANRIERKKAPEDLCGLAPAHPLPTTMLAAFAIDRRYQRQGFGGELLLHVFFSAAKAANHVVSHAIDLHAYDGRARAFYVKNGFKPLADPRRPDDLYILMKDVRLTLERFGHLAESTALAGPPPSR